MSNADPKPPRTALPRRFRKKSLPIEAAQWEPNTKPTDLPEWLWKMLVAWPELFDEHTGILKIRTLQGLVEAHPGDWICRQFVAGVEDIWPCNKAVFEEFYDPE
jgi:hypothetical protein